MQRGRISVIARIRFPGSGSEHVSAQSQRHPRHRLRRLGLSRPTRCARTRQGEFPHRVAVRRPELAGHLQPWAASGRFTRAGQYSQSAVGRRGDARAAVVINLVGILFERGRQSFEAVQATGAETIALAAAEARARLSCMFLALGRTILNRRRSIAQSKAAQGRGAGGVSARGDLSSVGSVRSGGRFPQTGLLRWRALAMLPLIGRRRNAVQAGLCRRCRRRDWGSCARQCDAGDESTNWWADVRTFRN